MAQIKKGTTYDSGDNRLVTPTNLNNHVENAVLYKGAITEQASLPTAEFVGNDDQILIANTSDTTGIYPNKVSAAKLLGSGIPITTDSVDVNGNINATSIFTDTLQVGDAAAEDSNIALSLKVLGNTQVSGTGYTGIAAGSTEERQSPLTSSAIRWNTDEEWLEAWDGIEWKQVGYSPFEASGGNIVLEPSETVVPATFTSTDSGTTVTVTISAGHDICMGQVVELLTPTSGYDGEYVVTEIADIFTLKFRTGRSGLANVSNASCTVRKSGNHKVHIFKNSGYFNVGRYDIFADVLIVGGGGGRGQAPRWHNVGGGSGGVLLKRDVKFAAETEYSCTVGTGGASSNGDENGNDGNISSIAITGNSTTSFLYATGGKGGVNSLTGNSGYTSDNAHLPDEERRYLGTSTGDWANWGQAGAGAGGGQSCVPRHGSDSTIYAYINRNLPSGVVSDITNINTMYASSGGDNVCTRAWPVSLDNGMLSPVSEKGFVARGVGATAVGVSEPLKPENGQPGIVIIRYPYKLK